MAASSSLSSRGDAVSRLLEQALERAGREPVARIAGDGEPTAAARVLVLPVAAPGPDLHPAEDAQDVGDAHPPALRGLPRAVPVRPLRYSGISWRRTWRSVFSVIGWSVSERYLRSASFIIVW